MLALMMSIVGAQPTPQIIPPVVQEWPKVRAGAVLATPDWSDADIYPSSARAKNEEGSVTPQLLVGADGRPQACRILQSSHFTELDIGSCELMMKMRFEPARDRAGNPLPSQYSRPLVWLLADRRPFASSSLQTQVRIRKGNEESCDVIRAEGAYIAPWSALACAIFSDVAYYFGTAYRQPLNAIIEVRLDAGDKAPLLDEPWATGDLLSAEKVSFAVNDNGDASACKSLESHGFGPRGLNNLAVCGRLLSVLWFARPKTPKSNAKGTFETRVYVLPQPRK